MVQCISVLCVLGIVVLGLLVMTGAVDREQAGQAVGRAVGVMVFAWFASCILGMAFGAVAELLKHVMAWMAIVALALGLLLLGHAISLVKKFLGFKEGGGSHE